jgi:hypothetical protein
LRQRDKKAVLQARDTLLAYCRDTFAAFTWDMPLVEREGWGLSEYGMIERDVRHWDFVFMVTDIDLASHDKPYTFELKGICLVRGAVCDGGTRLAPY